MVNTDAPPLFAQEAKPFASEVNTLPKPGVPPAIFIVPVIAVFPPTFKFSPIPAPPVTFKAPEVVDVDVVFALIVVAPVMVAVKPTFNSLAIPTPPLTINAPVVEDVEAVIELIAVAPVITAVEPTLIAPAMPTPPPMITAPVVVLDDAVVLLKVFSPAKVCAAVVTTPPKLALAGCNVKVLVEILAPFAFDTEPIAAMVVTPASADHAGIPLTSANTWPFVPTPNRVPVPEVPP